MKPNRPFVLCATDFSPMAIETASVAARIAQQRSMGLRLIHATDASSARALSEMKKRLEAEVRRLGETGLVVEPLLLEGRRPTEEMLDYIQAEWPTLVVVSSGAKGPLDRWAMGSFSERIAERSPVPTLVMRNPALFDAFDWNKGRMKVLLALDPYATSDVVLRWAKAFRSDTPCDLVSCYINRRMPTMEEAAIPPGRPVNPPALQSRLERELRKKVRDQTGDDDSAIMVRPFFGDPGPSIMEIAGEVKAQLIAVGTHQRQGLGRLVQFSVSRELLRNAGANVVCVPVTATFDPRHAHIPDYRRVLVATDFSDLGNSAVPYACAACSIGGLVKIVHVTAPRSRSRAAGKERGADLRGQLRALIPDEMGARGQPPEVEVLEGSDVPGTLCAEAERFGADLVCVASHGLGGSRALHGSVAKGLLKEVRRPLLVIRRQEE